MSMCDLSYCTLQSSLFEVCFSYINNILKYICIIHNIVLNFIWMFPSSISRRSSPNSSLWRCVQCGPSSTWPSLEFSRCHQRSSWTSRRSRKELRDLVKDGHIPRQSLLKTPQKETLRMCFTLLELPGFQKLLGYHTSALYPTYSISGWSEEWVFAYIFWFGFMVMRLLNCIHCKWSIDKHCLLFYRSLFQMSAEDLVFLASPLTFDPSVVEIFLALSSGARLLIGPSVVKKAPRRLAQLLFKDHKTTVLQVHQIVESVYTAHWISKHWLLNQ